MRGILVSAVLGALVGAGGLALVVVYAPWGPVWEWAVVEGPSSLRAESGGSGASEAREVTEVGGVADAGEGEVMAVERLLPAEPLIEVERFAEVPGVGESGPAVEAVEAGAEPEVENPPASERADADEEPSERAERQPVDYRELGDRIFEVAEALDRFKDKLRQSTEWERAEEGQEPEAEQPEGRLPDAAADAAEAE